MSVDLKSLHFEPGEDAPQVMYRVASSVEHVRGTVLAIDFQDHGIMVEHREFTANPEDEQIRRLTFIPYCSLVEIRQQYNDQD